MAITADGVNVGQLKSAETSYIVSLSVWYICRTGSGFVLPRWEFLPGCRNCRPDWLSLPRDTAAPPLVKTKPSRRSSVDRPHSPLHRSTSTSPSYSSTLFSVTGAGGRNANGWVYSGLQLANDDKYSHQGATGRLLMVRRRSPLRQLSSCVHLPLFPSLLQPLQHITYDFGHQVTTL